MSQNNNMSEEDYLKKHLNSIEDQTQKNQNFTNSDIPSNQPVIEQTRVSDLHFFNFEISQLPCGKFYPNGTIFMIRPAQVKEIQAYSMVDDNNFYDIVEKMNGMLQSCVRIKYPDGRMGTYLDIKDQDRLFLIFMIRELTFQQGNSLTMNSTCQSCNSEVTIELKRQHFVFFEEEERMKKFYSPNRGTYFFTLKNGQEYEVTPPNIGLQKSFTDYIIKENNDKKTPNMAFLKIIPFLLPGKSSITYEGIKSKLTEFEKIDDISFQFLNSAINKMTFGIKELKNTCSCGAEVRAEMQFPNGASGIFLIHDAFEAYIKE